MAKHLAPTFGLPHPNARIVSDHGYPRFMWKEDGEQRSMSVHRWVWVQKTGKPIPDGHYIRFKNGDKWDWRIRNLELVSPTEHGQYPTTVTPEIRDGKKKCGVCNRWKKLDRFMLRKTKSGKESYHTECRDCHAQYMREYRADDPKYHDKERTRGRARREADRTAYNDYHREYYHRKKREQKQAKGKLVRVRWKGRKWCKGHLTRERDKWTAGEAMTLCGKPIPYSDQVEFENGTSFPIACTRCQKACLLEL